MQQYIEEGFELYKEDGKPCYEDGDRIDDSGIDSKYCPFCSGDKYTNEDLLNYLLKKHDLTKEKVAEEFLSWKQAQEIYNKGD